MVLTFAWEKTVIDMILPIDRYRRFEVSKVWNDGDGTAKFIGFYQWDDSGFEDPRAARRFFHITNTYKTMEGALGAVEAFIEDVVEYNGGEDHWTAVSPEITLDSNITIEQVKKSEPEFMRHQLQLVSARNDENPVYFVRWQPWYSMGCPVTHWCHESTAAMLEAEQWVKDVSALKRVGGKR